MKTNAEYQADWRKRQHNRFRLDCRISDQAKQLLDELTHANQCSQAEAIERLLFTQAELEAKFLQRLNTLKTEFDNQVNKKVRELTKSHWQQGFYRR